MLACVIPDARPERAQQRRELDICALVVSWIRWRYERYLCKAIATHDDEHSAAIADARRNTRNERFQRRHHVAAHDVRRVVRAHDMAVDNDTERGGGKWEYHA